jgi:hypothetical protein
MEQTITVRFIETKQVTKGKNVGNAYWVVVDTDDHKWSIFDKALAESFVIAKTYNIRTEKNGEYVNLKENLGESSNEAVTETVKNSSSTAKGIHDVEMVSTESSNVSVVINRKENANSYEFGKAGDRIKIYFETIAELREKVDALNAEGFGKVEGFDEKV